MFIQNSWFWWWVSILRSHHQRGYEQNNRLIAFWVAFWDIFCLAFWVAFSEHFMMSTPAAYGGLRTSPHITTTYHTPPSAEQCFPYCWTSVWYRRFQWIPVVAIQVTQGRTVVKFQKGCQLKPFKRIWIAQVWRFGRLMGTQPSHFRLPIDLTGTIPPMNWVQWSLSPVWTSI